MLMLAINVVPDLEVLRETIGKLLLMSILGLVLIVLFSTDKPRRRK